MTFDVIIIGAGASGLIAAIHATQRGRKTLVIDHAPKAGQKMLITGGGKCNITNRHLSVNDYFGEDNTFCKYALKRFPTASVLHLLQEANIETEERELGRIFCKKGAHEIVAHLVRTAEQQGVLFSMNMHVSDIRHHNNTFIVTCETHHTNTFVVECETHQYQSEHLLIATGGLAWPQIGATDFGYTIAKQFGHTIIPLRPALAGFILPRYSLLRDLQGISLDVQVLLKAGSRIIEEPLLFTHHGISGPASLQASCFWEKGDTLLINFLPEDDIILQMHKPGNGKLFVKNLANRFLPERLAQALIPERFFTRKVAELSKESRKTIGECIHRYPVTPMDVEGYTKAEVTSGGVSTADINPKSMESQLVKGLYFSGEVIDITGRLGGYNIHWAFASGFIAGNNM